MIRCPHPPVAKPRMTHADTWKKRPVVLRYWEYKDNIKDWAAENNFALGNEVCVVFCVPMSKSWSKKKKAEMINTNHKQKPDIDNLLKGLLDALLEEDCKVHTVFSKKVWADEGSVDFCEIALKA